MQKKKPTECHNYQHRQKCVLSYATAPPNAKSKRESSQWTHIHTSSILECIMSCSWVREKDTLWVNYWLESSGKTKGQHPRSPGWGMCPSIRPSVYQPCVNNVLSLCIAWCRLHAMHKLRTLFTRGWFTDGQMDWHTPQQHMAVNKCHGRTTIKEG